MKNYHALRSEKINKDFGQGDVLVLFGELFSRGYANGLVDEAEARGMTIIRSTVGRRDKDGSLRALNQEELALQPKPLINIPLEAGFDLEKTSTGETVVDLLKDVKLSAWESFQLPKDEIEKAVQAGRKRFQTHLQSYVQELRPLLPKGKKVLFAHLMAGGVPRAKIVMPLMNRVFKGIGDRYLPSEQFWKSDIGQLCKISFDEVTAKTFEILVNETAGLRKQIHQDGGSAHYLAYGYHGTEVLIAGNYQWQTYSPYLQGFAKMHLEDFSRQFSQTGVTCAVYNCPEILTNSSSIFQGVEVPLYPLLGALKKEGPQSKAFLDLAEKCKSRLKQDGKIEAVLDICNRFLTSDIFEKHCDFDAWPTHSSKDQLATLLATSDELIELHQDQKNLMTADLSEIVFTACGRLMLSDIAKPEAAVSWINHDVIAKATVKPTVQQT